MRKLRITDRPDLYDWLYDDFAEDVPMYISLTRSHDKVLECGVGTGRIAIPLAREGKIVYGIDNSAEMLEQLKNKVAANAEPITKTIHPLLADMRHFDLAQKFPIAIVPFSTFNYLLSLEDQRSSLAAIRQHLTNDGTIVLELISFSLYPAWFENDPTMRLVKEKQDPQTGQIAQLWKVAGFDSATQIITENRHFRFYDARGLFEKEEVVYWENRFFFLGEIQLLLESAGFEIVNVYGDFAFKQYAHDSQVMVVVARLTTH
jgi:SAM-dependent methyltransferase